MTRHFVFGYGSLVNQATHDYAHTRPANLHGWQRAWVRSPRRRVCYLSIVPVEGGHIHGTLSEVFDHHWPELEDREAAYDLMDAANALHLDKRPEARLSTFTIPEGRYHIPDADSQVLLSYLDTVVQGYLALAGPDGVQAFFDSTQNWQATFINDRAAPIYRRHCPTTAYERALTDDHLARLSAQVKQL